MALPNIPRPKVREVAARDAGAVAARIENKLDPGRRHEVDEFLKPFLHSDLRHTPAYSRLKAVLEYRSARGQSPNEFMRELQKQGEKVIKQHRHEVSVAENHLRALRSGNNIQRLKNEVFLPLEKRAITATEAWRRVNSLVAASSGAQSAAPSANRSSSSHGSNPQGSHGSSGHGHSGSTGSTPPSSTPPGSTPPGSTPPSSQSGGGTSKIASAWDKVNHFVTTPYGHQTQSQTLTGLGGTVGVGVTGGGSVVVGGAAQASSYSGFVTALPPFTSVPSCLWVFSWEVTWTPLLRWDFVLRKNSEAGTLRLPLPLRTGMGS